MKRRLLFIILSLGLVTAACAEVMLQWFETEWDEMYRRLPEVAEIGYDYLWVPPPTKSPTGKGTKWGNVGYNLYDRFDLGDVPQRGSLATRYGTRGQGFLHETQWNYNQRRGYADGNAEEANELFTNYLAERDDALVFAEILSPWNEIEYWYGYGSNDRNPMRFLDYAYILTHVGMPMVYFTGSNLTWDDHNTRTWMRPGYDAKALADAGGDVANLVWIHQQFARGEEQNRWADGDYLAYERYDATASANQGLLLVALNDSGVDIEHELQTRFDDGTILHDYTGHFLEDWGQGTGNILVHSGGKANVKVPGNNGQGWVCFAPGIPRGLAISATQGGAPSPTMNWIVPGGIHAADKPRQVTRITSSNFTLNVTLAAPAGGTVDAVMLKWGQGVHLTGNAYNAGRDVVSGQFEHMNGAGTSWHLDIAAPGEKIPEGLNVIKCRAFVQRPAGQPALFNTETKVVYVDRHGPEVAVTSPAAGTIVSGDCVMELSNPDFTAYVMTVSVDGAPAEDACQVMKGSWRYDLRDLATGMHTVTVTTTEADWGEPRQVINSSVVTHVVQAVANTHPIDLSIAQDSTIELPFFNVAVDVSNTTPDNVRLYWDGYRLPFNAGALTHAFNGDVIHDADPANVVTDKLWGAFCNGSHFFEAVRVDGAVTSRVVRRVTFDLYGVGAIDSDGDALPDNVEMPFIDSQGAPGADAPWPGDSNQDFIPNYGEQWSRLNPYNHSTFYSGQWDNQQDFDGDGFSNGEEVQSGYAEGNIYKYDIYDAGSFPSGTPPDGALAIWSPAFPSPGQILRITYTANDGPLGGAEQVLIHIGHSKRTAGSWQEVLDTAMTPSGANWIYDYLVPTNATSIDFVLHDGTDTWDNNGDDWQVAVQASSNSWFSMDGTVDSANYLVFPDTMRIWAAVKGDNLYVATRGVAESPGANDHFLYVTDSLDDAQAPPWGKSGAVFFDTSAKPYLAAEGENDWEGWSNVSGAEANSSSGVLEGEINLRDAFGSMPDAVYVAAVSYGTGSDAINNQGPHTWDGDSNLDVTELLRLPLESIRDDDLDGTFDGGMPRMWTVINNATNDANYGLRRVFIDERAGQMESLTVILEPNIGAGETIGNVELFSNVNRRDYAVIPGDEDRDMVTTASVDTYYRAYPMTSLGGGRYAATVTLRKCGAYRVNARYRINAGPYRYYTDNGLRRDCAVVVSPRKALDLTMYELNPLFAEATSDRFPDRSTFADMFVANTDRPDRLNTDTFAELGVNMIWLQPIHPIGNDGRQTDPATGSPYDPGSPYAVRNYWQVNQVLGDPATRSRAMDEFTAFVAALDANGIGVMLDGTFNHSAWDCEIGQVGVDMFDWATNATDLIRDVRPQWYSRKNGYGNVATHYFGGSTHDIAVAPDRIDFGKWPDAADFHYGLYDALVQQPPADTNNAWASSWHKRFLLEEDRFDGFVDDATRELWQYFARYPLYWLEKTGHPAGTPSDQSHRGIDGLRCDFAQGLPSHFWEYCINRTRSVKWDFIFMAESLDGYVEVNGSKRHGVGYRSARHFDILNENLVFYWRDRFFNYFDQGNATPTTFPTWQALDDRRNAFDASPLLLNLTSHDEILPSDDPYALLYAYAELAAIDGVPMLFYGQEAGLQNDRATYAGVPDASHNFARYESNFGKSIPNFKRYNSMANVWQNADTGLQMLYGRINRARLGSAALRSPQNYYLSRTDTGAYDPGIFAVARYERPGLSAATQDVVFVFVNNDVRQSTNRWATYSLNATYQGHNWFGIDPARDYNLVDLLSPTPGTYVWGSNRTGADIIAGGITVGLTGNPEAGEQAQYLKLIDVAVGSNPPDADGDGIPYFSDWDDDNDGLPDAWEDAHGLNPRDASGVNGRNGDWDNDGLTNHEEFLAGTHPRQPESALSLAISRGQLPSELLLEWQTVPERDYVLETIDTLPSVQEWTRLFRGTALSTNQLLQETLPASQSNAYYRVRLQ